MEGGKVCGFFFFLFGFHLLFCGRRERRESELCIFSCFLRMNEMANSKFDSTRDLVTGILKGHDQLMNLVLDDVMEVLHGEFIVVLFIFSSCCFSFVLAHSTSLSYDLSNETQSIIHSNFPIFFYIEKQKTKTHHCTYQPLFPQPFLPLFFSRFRFRFLFLFLFFHIL